MLQKKEDVENFINSFDYSKVDRTDRNYVKEILTIICKINDFIPPLKEIGRAHV